MGGHPIPVNDLNEVARGEGLTFQCVQHEKTTDCAFYVAHSYRFRRHRATGQHEGERPEPSTWYQETLYQDTPFCESRLCICFLKYLLAYAGGSPRPILGQVVTQLTQQLRYLRLLGSLLARDGTTSAA